MKRTLTKKDTNEWQFLKNTNDVTSDQSPIGLHHEQIQSAQRQVVNKPVDNLESHTNIYLDHQSMQSYGQ